MTPPAGVRTASDVPWWGVLALCAALVASAIPAAADSVTGEAVFVRNCGTCHVISSTPEERQGPNLFGVLGRPAGKLQGFRYSKPLAHAKFTWTREKLDAWLTDTTKIVPGSVMNYRQADPAVRSSILDYLEAAGGAAK